MNTYCTQTPSWLFFKQRFWDVWKEWQDEQAFHQDWVSHMAKICQEWSQCVPKLFGLLGSASASDHPALSTHSQDTLHAGLLWFFPSLLSDQKWAMAKQLTLLQNLPWRRHLAKLFTFIILFNIPKSSWSSSTQFHQWENRCGDAVQLTQGHAACKWEGYNFNLSGYCKLQALCHFARLPL